MNTKDSPGGPVERMLLALAAKEAGYKIGMWIDGDEPYSGGPGYIVNDRLWNPLLDDGDALRLAVDVGLLINPECAYRRRHASAQHHTNIRGHWWFEPHGNDKHAAVRRVIVRAAAGCGDV